jgi:hypothetical protein
MFHQKLNQQFTTDNIIKKDLMIEYGLKLPFKFFGIWYSYVDVENNQQLMNVIPERYRNNCLLYLLESNFRIPPHTDSEVSTIINFYVKTDGCITQFYYPNDSAERKQIKNQTTGHILNEKDLIKSTSFIAQPGDAYLLDVSKPHAVLPPRPRLFYKNRMAVTLQIRDKSFDEVLEMLNETGFV